jgi:hypothetical protein
MATHRLNVGRIQGCPSPAQLEEALADFGLPETEEFGVLNHSATPEAVFGTVVRTVQQSVQRLDAKAQQVSPVTVEKVLVYPFAVRPKAELLEVYAGSGTVLEQMGTFFAGCLALPVLVEPIELDLPAALEKLAARTERYQLRSVRVSEYAHSSYMSGPYAPRFLDSDHGMDFLAEYAEFVTSATVRFAAPAGRASVKLSPKASFSFSCQEDDRPAVLSVLRRLL